MPIMTRPMGSIFSMNAAASINESFVFDKSQIKEKEAPKSTKDKGVAIFDTSLSVAIIN